ncbi:MAG: hypothetical protein JWR80_3397 [Bradyrhizobium sp.]|nr:hypothetical protein [Bradyrhizobium sp.]
MSQAISSSLAYAAANGDYRSSAVDAEKPAGQTAPSPQPETSQRSPATVVSLSPDAWGTLHTELSSLPALPEHDVPTPADMARFGETRQVQAKLRDLDQLDKARAANEEALKNLQSSYDRMRDTAPKAAVVLNADDTAKALQMLKDAGRTLSIPKGGTYGYVQDGIQYMFKSDGTVTTQQEGVATSPAGQQEALAKFSGTLAYFQNQLRDTAPERAALVARQATLQGGA